MAVADAPPWVAVKTQLRADAVLFSDTVTVFPERKNPSAPPLMVGTADCVVSYTPFTKVTREAPALSIEVPPCQDTDAGVAVNVTDQPP